MSVATEEIQNNSHSFVAEKIRVIGIVQGVGFRPYVWRLANQLKLTGDVINDGQGVVIKVWGNTERIDQFIEQRKNRCTTAGTYRSNQTVFVATE